MSRTDNGCFGRVGVAITTVCLLAHSFLLGGAALNLRLVEGDNHGYLILRDVTSKTVGSGEFTQIAEGHRVRARLTFRFTDGSIDDESTVYSQDQGIRLLNDHHVQNGPSFPHPVESWIDMALRQVRFRDYESGSVTTEQMALPSDLCNGLVLTLTKHLQKGATLTQVPYLAEFSKPRLVKLSISQDGETRFRVGPSFHRAIRYVIKVELGGLEGVVAPLVGKQPTNSYIWLAGNAMPAIVRVDTALFPGGPIMSIRPATTIW